MVGDRVGPLKRNRRERPRGVVQGEAQVVRPDAPRAPGAALPHAEDRRRIARTARLEVADQLLQLVAHETQRQLEVDALGGHQVVGAQKLARDGEKRNTERVVALPADGEARGHGVTAVFLEMVPDPLQRGVQIEARHAPPRAPPPTGGRGPAGGGPPGPGGPKRPPAGGKNQPGTARCPPGGWGGPAPGVGPPYFSRGCPPRCSAASRPNPATLRPEPRPTSLP